MVELPATKYGEINEKILVVSRAFSSPIYAGHLATLIAT